MMTRTLRSLLPALFLATTFAACATAPQNASVGVVNRDDEQAIDKLVARRQLVVQRGDATALAQLFTDDAIIMPTNRPSIVGTMAIRKWQSAFADEFELAAELSTEEITVVGDWAYVRIRVSGTLTRRLGGDPTTINGKELALLQRQSDGKWKFARLMGNSNISTSRDPLSAER